VARVAQVVVLVLELPWCVISVDTGDLAELSVDTSRGLINFCILQTRWNEEGLVMLVEMTILIVCLIR
jgi:hypothetical protein